MLAWPPPGLESLHGRIADLARPVWAASVVVAGAFVLFVWAGDIASTPAFAILAGALLFGMIRMLMALRSVAGAAGAASRAIRQGYTWLTVAEVIADRRRDTGALIAGINEYERQPPAVRATLRVLRLVSGGLQLCTAVLPVPSLILGVLLADRLNTPLLALITFAPALLLSFARILVDQVEYVTVGPARTSHEGRLDGREARANVIEPWYAAFDAARAGQPIGRGRPGGRWWGTLAVTAGGLLMVAGVGVLVPVCLVAANGTGIAYLSQTRTLPIERGRSNAMRRYVVDRDPSISAARAGQAFYRAVTTEAAAKRDSMLGVPWSRPPFPPLPRRPDSAFFVREVRGYVREFHLAFLQRVKTGLSRAEEQYLEAVATHPAWEEFSIAARAASMDYNAARFGTRLPAGFSAFAMPVAWTARDIAIANTARAAWHLRHGRRDSAERVLRETIANGFHLVDAGASESDARIGATMVDVGRVSLAEFYALTNPAAAAQLRAALDSTGTRSQRAIGVGSRAAVATAIRDSTLARGTRQSLVLIATVSNCASVRGLLFGPDASMQRAFDVARRQLVRTELEGELFDAFSHALDRPMPVMGVRRPTRSVNRPVLTWAAGVSARVLGRPRIANCTSPVSRMAF